MNLSIMENFSFSTFVFILFIVILILLLRGIKIVPQAEKWVIERLGSYNRTLEGGLNYVVPILDSIRARFMTQEQVIDIPTQQVITRDNVSITIDGLVFIRVTDAQKTVYGILDMRHAVAQLAQTTLRSEIGKMDLDDSLSSRDLLNSALLSALDLAAGGWGVKVTRVEISDIDVSSEVKKAMELQLRAERERRATESRAEGDKNAAIAQAEGDRQRVYKEAEAIERTADAKKYEQIQLATGQKEAMEMISSVMQNNPQAAEFLLAKDRIKAFNDLANNTNQDKVIVPYEANALVGALSIVTDSIKQMTPKKKPTIPTENNDE